MRWRVTSAPASVYARILVLPASDVFHDALAVST
jgi:hypothetical protein